MSSVGTSLGCTLVEALVACGLSACALAATLALQGRALAATRAAREFSVAALHASSMAAMVQANAHGWAQAARVPAAPQPDCALQPCDGAQLATFDAARWRRGLAQALRGARGDVRCSEHRCVVAVRWSSRTLRRLVSIDAARQPAAPARCASRIGCASAGAARAGER
jgi:Tfp pilus assembly protein PilV